jgi:hypothetical protein
VSLAIRNSHLRHACAVDAKSLALSFASYLNAHRGCLPPPFIEDQETGQRHSWRVLLLPNRTYDFVYGCYSFHDSWESARNSEVGRTPQYACCAHSTSPEMTNYVAVVGKDTLWPEPAKPAEYEYITVGENDTRWPAPKGTHVPPECRNKIMLVELVKSTIPWMEPRDVTLDEFIDAIKQNPKGEFYNKYVNGIRAIDASGQVRVIDPYDDIDKIRDMFLTGREDASASAPSATESDQPAE